MNAIKYVVMESENIELIDTITLIFHQITRGIEQTLLYKHDI